VQFSIAKPLPFPTTKRKADRKCPGWKCPAKEYAQIAIRLGLYNIVIEFFTWEYAVVLIASDFL